MSYNRRSGGGGYGGYGNSGGAGGGRYNNSGGGGGYRSNAGTVNPWQTNTGAGGQIPRQPQQGGHPPPAQLAMASNIISKLLTSSNSMSGTGYGGGPNRGGNWNNSGPRMAHMPMRRQDGPGGFNKDNRRRGGGDHHNRFSGGGRKSGGGMKDGEKRKNAGKANDENKKGQNDRERTKEQLDADKKASYVGVPSAVLYCHVCSKHMWDSESFEKHVRGRPHELMMTYLDEAYRMRVDFMRHQIKAVENQREIDLERVTNNKNKSNSGNKNAGGNSNSSKPLLRSYCPMCDVRFYGPLTGHRKSDRHRKLKQFLHPECKLCDALFHTRLEMDEHKLTAGHLKKVAELRNIEYPHLKDDEFDLIDMIKIEEEDQLDQDQMPVAKKYEMLNDRDATKLKLELEGGSGDKHRDKKNSAAETKATATINKSGNKETEGEKEKKQETETSDVATGEEAVTDQSIKEETSTNVATKDNQTIAYDPNVAIGKELLVSSVGFVCRLCNCFLLDEQRVSLHCQTAAHYINYTTMTKMKEATLGSKKRGIDQVNVEASISKQDVIAKEGESSSEVNRENVISQIDKPESEEPSVKRMKLENDGNAEKMDTNDDLVTKETGGISAKKNNTEKVGEAVTEEKPVEVAQQPVAPVAATTPNRGRGGGRRGIRGSGVARRGGRR